MGLGKQVGPLPLGAWLGIVVGGLGIGYLINRSQSKGPEPQLLAESGVGTGGQQLIYEPPQTVTGVETEKTNLSWGRDATNWLITQGQDSYNADLAIRKYLTGEPLTVPEKAMLGLVLARFGAPPEALPTTDPTPTPTPTPTPAAATYFMQFTTSPKNPVGKRPWKLTGIILKDGKPTAGTIRVDYNRAGRWSPNGFAPYIFANVWGNWVFLHPGLGADALFRFTWVRDGVDVKSISWTARVR
jgi:hypothetical protein